MLRPHIRHEAIQHLSDIRLQRYSGHVSELNLRFLTFLRIRFPRAASVLAPSTPTVFFPSGHRHRHSCAGLLDLQRLCREKPDTKCRQKEKGAHQRPSLSSAIVSSLQASPEIHGKPTISSNRYINQQPATTHPPTALDKLFHQFPDPWSQFPVPYSLFPGPCFSTPCANRGNPNRRAKPSSLKPASIHLEASLPTPPTRKSTCPRASPVRTVYPSVPKSTPRTPLSTSPQFHSEVF